jgi:MFS family permease
VALVGALAAGIINASFYGLAPVFAQRIGLSLHQTSLFMASVVMSGILLQWPVGRLSDRFGRTRVLATVSGGTTLACLVIVLASRSPGPLLFIAAACYGSMVFTLYSLSAAQANDRSRPEDMVQTAGALLVAYGIGAIAGPVTAGLALRWLGPPGLFILNGLSALLLTAYALSPMARSLPGEAGAPYLPKVGTQFSSEILYRDVRDTLDRDLGRLGGQPGRRF